jgi:MoxR-like ATPase
MNDLSVTTETASTPTALSDRVKHAVRRAIIGLDSEVESCLVAALAGGHVLLEGPPGVAKTLLVRTLATALGGTYGRIQFTPDLMPADVTGTSVYRPAEGRFRFQPGPVFAQVLLCDEINRAPAKTQAALLEAMQEGAVTVDGERHLLPAPFCVFATMNPIEHEGTYPLPEAQLDRFLFNTVLDYLSADDEMKVIGLTTTTSIAQAEAVTTAEELLSFQQLVRMVPIADSVARYAIDIVRATRSTDSTAPDFISKYVNFGASVRGVQNLVLAAKARALMHRRYHVTYDDIAALVVPVMRHRILLNFHAESDKLDQDKILKRLLEAMPPPRS